MNGRLFQARQVRDDVRKFGFGQSVFQSTGHDRYGAGSNLFYLIASDPNRITRLLLDVQRVASFAGDGGR